MTEINYWDTRLVLDTPQGCFYYIRPFTREDKGDLLIYSFPLIPITPQQAEDFISLNQESASKPILFSPDNRTRLDEPRCMQWGVFWRLGNSPERLIGEVKFEHIPEPELESPRSEFHLTNRPLAAGRLSMFIKSEHRRFFPMKDAYSKLAQWMFTPPRFHLRRGFGIRTLVIWIPSDEEQMIKDCLTGLGISDEDTHLLGPAIFGGKPMYEIRLTYEQWVDNNTLF